MKHLTTEEFAALEGVVPGTIRKRIHEGVPLPVGVTLTRHGRDHVFNVSLRYTPKRRKNTLNKIRK